MHTLPLYTLSSNTKLQELSQKEERLLSVHLDPRCNYYYYFTYTDKPHVISRWREREEIKTIICDHCQASSSCFNKQKSRQKEKEREWKANKMAEESEKRLHGFSLETQRWISLSHWKRRGNKRCASRRQSPGLTLWRNILTLSELR